VRHRLTVLALLVTAAMCVVGCGGDVKQEGQALRAQSLLAGSPPLARAIVTDQEIAKYSPDSIQNAFLSFWQNLQFHSWRDGLSWYDPALQRFIGPQRIINGLEALASFYRVAKPVIDSVTRTGYDTMQIHYLVSLPAGPIELETIEWRRVGSAWRIEFDSFLNQGLVSYSEEAEQNQIDPTAQTPSVRAVHLGEKVGHIQAEYLATLINRTYSAHRGSYKQSP
jgi:hypothetical protein